MDILEELVRRQRTGYNKHWHGKIIISSRIRLARNIKNHLFPSYAREAERIAVWETIKDVIKDLSVWKKTLVFEPSKISNIDKQVLIERNLISNELAEAGKGSGVATDTDESVSIMINEEDNIRIQAVSSGMNLNKLWEQIDKIDDEIGNSLPYAFSDKYGYLCACPTNVGTGLRASIMLHLPALTLSKQIRPVLTGISRIGFTVRGSRGEGSEPFGNTFQISNQSTLGEDEQTIIGSIEMIGKELAEHEQNARLRLIESNPDLLKDRVGKAYGILSHAYILNTKEALDMLSMLKLGIDTGLITEYNSKIVDELFMLILPGHLQALAGKAINSKKLGKARASLIKKKLYKNRNKRSKTRKADE
jgi:protein arginine kinase